MAASSTGDKSAYPSVSAQVELVRIFIPGKNPQVVSSFRDTDK